MLDIIDVAREHGIKEGRNLGSLETSRKMLLNLLMEKFGGLPPELTANIRQISDQDFLEFLFSKAIRCESVQAFEQILSRSE